MYIQTLCLIVSSADNLYKQVKPDKMSGLIWIQVDLHSDVIHEKVCRNMMILKKNQQTKLPIMQRVKTGIHQWLIVGNRTRAILFVELCHVLGRRCIGQLYTNG